VTRLITQIAWDDQRNLGAAYNRAMGALSPGDWCCFLDHDAMFTSPGWRDQLRQAIAENPRAGLIAAYTNRIGRKTQIAPGCPQSHDLLEHAAFGAELAARYAAAARDITADSPISGVVMAMSRETWALIGGFRDGFFGVDNWAHRDVRSKGLRVMILPGLYVYHWYRADGVGHPGAPKAAA
jgi:GT2 family glycosyltransferase